MSNEIPVSCQWCGAEVWPEVGWRGYTLFTCFTVGNPGGGWSIGESCKERCADQMAELRALTAADVTPEQLGAWQEMTIEGDANEDQKSIVAAVRVMIGGAR